MFAATASGSVTRPSNESDICTPTLLARMVRNTRWSFAKNDWLGFLGAYVACLVGALVFIF